MSQGPMDLISDSTVSGVEARRRRRASRYGPSYADVRAFCFSAIGLFFLALLARRSCSNSAISRAPRFHRLRSSQSASKEFPFSSLRFKILERTAT